MRNYADISIEIPQGTTYRHYGRVAEVKEWILTPEGELVGQGFGIVVTVDCGYELVLIPGTTAGTHRVRKTPAPPPVNYRVEIPGDQSNDDLRNLCRQRRWNLVVERKPAQGKGEPAVIEYI